MNKPTEVNLAKFRSGEKGATAFASSCNSSKWLSGDSLGEAIVLEKSCANDSHEIVEESLTAVALNPAANCCVLAYQNSIHLHDFPAVDKTTFAMADRFTLPITHTSFESEGTHIFSSSMEPDIHVYSISSKEVEFKIRTNGVGVRTFAVSSLFRQGYQYIGFIDEQCTAYIHRLNTTSGETGKIYASSDLENRLGKVVSVDVVRDHTSIGCQLSWHPALPCVAIPSKSGSVLLVVRNEAVNNSEENGWNEIILADQTTHMTHGEKDVTVAKFSPNGLYLATADIEGAVLIWSLEYRFSSRAVAGPTLTAAPIRMLTCAEEAGAGAVVLMDVCWGAQENDNYLMLLSGSSWGRVDDIISRTLTKPTANVSPVTNHPFAAGSDAAKCGIPVIPQHDPLTAIPSAKDSKSVVVPGMARLQKKSVASIEDDDDAMFDSHVDSETPSAPTVPPLTALQGNAVLHDDSDDEEDYLDEESLDGEEPLTLTVPTPAAPTLCAQDIQPVVLPSSTDFDNHGRRYLVWNSIGNIISRIDGGNTRIEIRLSSFNSRTEAFTDHYGFSMAAISHGGAVFACPAEAAEDLDGMSFDVEADKKRRGSVIYYFAFAQGGMNRNGVDTVVASETFTIILPAGEGVLSVATGTGWCAVATSAGYLRIYSSTGVQLAVTWLKGPVAAMCGDCGSSISRSRLAIVYHTAANQILKEGSNVLSPELHLDLLEMGAGSALQLRRRALLSSFPVPLSTSMEQPSIHMSNSLVPKKKEHCALTWLGFDSEDGTLVIMDSKGCFSALLHTIGGACGWEWMPVLDVNVVKTGVDHFYWPVMVKSSRLVYCLLNGEKTPAIYPPPVLSHKTFRMPIAGVREGKDKEIQNDLIGDAMWENIKVHHLESEKRNLEEDVTTGNPSDTVDSCELLDKLESQCNDRQLQADKAVLRLLQQACMQGKGAFAIDLSLRFLRTEKVMSAATTIANHFGRTNVANAIQKQLTKKQEEDALAAATNVDMVQEEEGEHMYEGGGLFSNPNRSDATSFRPSECEDGYESEEVAKEVSYKKRAPMNPFAISSPVRDSDASPTGVPSGVRSGRKLKRKGNVFDNMKQAMVGSPSPKKPPATSRQSSVLANRSGKLAHKRLT